MNDMYKSGEGYHDVPPPYTRTFMPPKPDLVFNDAPTASETVTNNSDFEDETEIEFVPKQKEPSFVLIFEHEKTPRESVKKVEHPKQAENLRTDNQKSRGNPQQALKDKGVIDSGCSRHMTGNISFLSDFEEINGGFVALGGNPKGGKIIGKCKIKTGKLDFDDVCFVKELKFNLFSVSQMVPRENNMYNGDLKNVVLSGDLTCLFAKATLDESNNWHRRISHINLKTMNEIVKGNQPNHNAGIKENINADDDAAFDVQKNENKVHVSPSESDKTKKHDDKAKRVDKGKSPIGKSSFIDPSNFHDDLDMPALEDIIYLDYEEDVSAEADLSNLETNISVSPILTTSVHKDHHVTQIIGDLTSAPQITSMARIVKEQGGLN
nr:hypothetical protein [Tanacetum cinerariifolium]